MLFEKECKNLINVEKVSKRKAIDLIEMIVYEFSLSKDEVLYIFERGNSRTDIDVHRSDERMFDPFFDAW